MHVSSDSMELSNSSPSVSPVVAPPLYVLPAKPNRATNGTATQPTRVRPRIRWRGHHGRSRSDLIDIRIKERVAEDPSFVKRETKRTARRGAFAAAWVRFCIDHWHRFGAWLRQAKSRDDAPTWLVSLAIHLLVLLVLALITITQDSSSSITLMLQPNHASALTEFVEFSIEPFEIDVPIIEDVPLEEVNVFDNDSKVHLELMEAKLTPVNFEHQPAALATSPTSQIKGMFAARSGDLKQKLLRQSGGDEATENAVSMGLQWLQRNQLRDGSWSLRGPYRDGARTETRVAATAMAMIAFMGAGNTHLSGEYRRELMKAARWMAKRQDAQGFMAADASDHDQMYAQAQAMIALCELYAMTKDTWIERYAQSSCDFACRAQSPQGGWRYRPRFDSDTSVTGWFVMGLKSAEAGELNVDTAVFDRVDQYLDTVSAGGERDYYAIGYSYQVGDSPSPSMTAEALLCRQYLGWHRNMPGMRRGLDALVQNHPISVQNRDVYYWYYATQALHHFGGPMWEQWNQQLKDKLPASQLRKGRERGSWSPAGDAWGDHAGRLYTTCLSIYCLEVYYRHMPLYTSEVEP